MSPATHGLPLVLGTMYFGTRTDQATSFAMLDRFVEAGGTVVDTANCYAFWASDTGAGGQSESVIGRWLAANAGMRDYLTLATKVGVEPVTPGVSTDRSRGCLPQPMTTRARPAGSRR